MVDELFCLAHICPGQPALALVLALDNLNPDEGDCARQIKTCYANGKWYLYTVFVDTHCDCLFIKHLEQRLRHTRTTRIEANVLINLRKECAMICDFPLAHILTTSTTGLCKEVCLKNWMRVRVQVTPLM